MRLTKPASLLEQPLKTSAWRSYPEDEVELESAPLPSAPLISIGEEASLLHLVQEAEAAEEAAAAAAKEEVLIRRACAFVLEALREGPAEMEVVGTIQPEPISPPAEGEICTAGPAALQEAHRQGLKAGRAAAELGLQAQEQTAAGAASLLGSAAAVEAARAHAVRCVLVSSCRMACEVQVKAVASCLRLEEQWVWRKENDPFYGAAAAQAASDCACSLDVSSVQRVGC